MKSLAAVAFAAVVAAAAPSSAQVVGLGTNPQGSLYYTMGVALAKVIAEKAGIQMRVQPIGGTSQLMPQLERGEIEFGIFSAIDMTDGYEGKGSYPGKPVQGLRAVGVLGPLYFTFFVRSDNPARTIAETKGQKVPTEFPAGLVVLRAIKGLIASEGYTLDDYVQQPVANLAQAATAFKEGRVDLGALPVGAGAVRELDAEVRGGIRHVPMRNTPDALARMRREVAVSYISVINPSPAYVGVREPTAVMTFDIYLATSKDTKPALVEKVVAAVHDHKDDLVAAFAGFRTFDPRQMAKDFPVPYHPGAIAYYTAKGSWPPKKN
jgi:TRAP transporter TAXI family solute receptor